MSTATAIVASMNNSDSELVHGLDYEHFLSRKRVEHPMAGFDVDASSINQQLFPFQRRIVQWALRRGKAAVFADCGLGKALASGTHVQTPSGGKAIGDLKPGDAVLGRSGLPVEVMGVYPQGTRPLYRVSFSDGVSTLADGEHLWYVETQLQRYHHRRGRVLTTAQLAGAPLMDTVGRSRFFIPIAEPLEFDPVALPLDPYLLGVLLGDGNLATYAPTVTITSVDTDLIYSLVLPNRIRPVLATSDGETPTYRLAQDHAGIGDRNEILVALEEMGLRGCRSHQKFIPPAYLRASVAERLSLLQGLMDTDGYGNSDGLAQFTSTSKCLAEGVRTLTQSLGGTASLREKRPVCVHADGRRVDGATAWNVSVRLPAAFAPFRLVRKVSAYRSHTSYTPCRSIRSIELVGRDDATCIAVRSGDSLFVTEHGVVTHNTPMQLEWASHVYRETGRNVLILAPLAVSHQTSREAEKFGITVHIARTQEDVLPGITVTNYEMLHHFDADAFGGLVLDESSILKGKDGVYRQEITRFVSQIPYRLACTATPAPNDLVEIVNHAEFLGIMREKEVIALFFTQDGNSAHQFRLKGHARTDFWRWMASWSVAIRKPSDVGDDDGAFVLPALEVHQHQVNVTHDGLHLFPMEALTLQERLAARRDSISERVTQCADLINRSRDAWLVWCNLNAEGEALRRAIPGAMEIKGSDTTEHKEKALLAFLDGSVRVLITKPSIAGFGLNMQHCHNMAFVGLSDSFEQWYQAVRRCWRFGQQETVHAHVIVAETEGAVVANIQRKEREATNMMNSVIEHMGNLQLEQAEKQEMEYEERVVHGDTWTLYQGDSVEVMRNIESESVGLTIFSPPFPGMYAYTNSMHDMGNVRNIDEMLEQFRFLVDREHLLRVTMPGRLCCIHLTQAPARKGRDGFIGLMDFRGKTIQLMIDEGWIYHGEVTIDKNPQLKAQRTKDQGLLFKSLANDSAQLHMALADYLIYFRKPGENPHPIRAGQVERYGNNPDGWITAEEWIEWAAPVWYRATPNYPGGIRETDVLNVQQARETDDERHLAPLQLGVIERAVKLWSAPGELVLDPFNGIGSTGVVALGLGRQYVGIELKRSYFETAAQNLRDAEHSMSQPTLFDGESA